MLPYEGYVRFLVNLSGRRGSVVKYHHHGFGMAQRSKGTLTADIISSQRPDANIVHLGHNHNNYIVRLPRERLNAKGRVYTDCCWHIRTGGYKPTSNSGDGWGVERGHGPCALGAAWLRIRVSKTGNFLDIVVDAFHAS
ncbi:MAG: hypothetical protein N2111_14420 [Candidatus Sumerlaeaceae bacterium]|nr:hypothetical protein [Candidatus Sumerlaeaceae bacterium]